DPLGRAAESRLRSLPDVSHAQLKSREPGALPLHEIRPEGYAGYITRGVIYLALLLAILHGMALWDGVILDDHWHQKGLREHGWSFSELLRTTDIRPSDFMHCWWQTRLFRWEYPRPVFILCMKLFYWLGGGNPKALHALSLLLH